MSVSDSSGTAASASQSQSAVIEISFTTSYTWIYNDQGSGSNMDLTIYRPVPPSAKFFIVGDYAQGNYSGAVGSSMVVAAIGDDPQNPLLKAPSHYEQVWNDQGSHGNHDGSIWFPVAPEGYVALGYVGNSGYASPSIPNYVCVRRDLTVPSQAGNLIWNDQRSGSRLDVSLYQLGGISGAFVAQGNYSAFQRSCFKFHDSFVIGL